ncbi:MAG: hypothetical protein ABEJ07_01825 [Candidatus Nanohaloarchaea archaeon]
MTDAGISAGIFREQSEVAQLVLEAKEVDIELIRQLPPAYRYQFSRVRDDVDLKQDESHGGDNGD